ncbi:hypothetical protein AB0C59_13160 [Streptomyces sp. NPDC048664]|uniref:hypothetical protein n=1 Tax=Streptomyces sp. NPDC048664 TaxID=3154505 RepID=UPI003439E859
MRTTVKTRALLAGAVLLATAACGSGSGTGHDKGGNEGSAASSPAGHGPDGRPGTGGAPADRTGKRLEGAVVEGTVAGYKVDKPAARDIPPGGGYEVDREECAPLGALIGGHLPGKPTGEVYRTLKPADPKNATIGNLWLSAYGGDGGDRAVAAVDTAVDACKGSFRTAGLTYHSVERIGSAESGAAAFRVTGDVGKQRIVMNYRVVRSGAVVASFYGVNMLHPKDGSIPDAVVDAQLQRLRKG